MEPTSVAAISTGGLATAGDVLVDLPIEVRMVLDRASADTIDATFESLIAVLRGPADEPVHESARIAPITVRPAPVSSPAAPVFAWPVTVVAPFIVVSDRAVREQRTVIADAVATAIVAPREAAVASPTTAPRAAEPAPVNSRRPSMTVRVFVPMLVVLAVLALGLALIG